MKIYYAHHLWKYNTPIEEHEIETIKRMFPDAEIVNPNGTIDQTKTESEIMIDCFRLISECDRLIFSTLSGVIGKGVYQEILFAQTANLPIYEIKDHKLYWRNAVNFQFILLNSGNNRVYAVVEDNL